MTLNAKGKQLTKTANIMKKNLLLMLLSLAFTLNGNAVSVNDGFYETNVANYITIEMQCEYVKPTKVKNGASRLPMKSPMDRLRRPATISI